MEAQVEEFADFHFTDTLTLKDLMAKTQSLSYLALEEANHEFWTYGRIVCLGDAIHKMTPNVRLLLFLMGKK
jgi:FAD dependent monooxygenase